MKKIQKPLMTGVSYMLPLIVFAGITIAVTNMIGQSVSKDIAWVNLMNGFAWKMMGLIPAIMAAFIAYAISDKLAIAPGFLGGYLASMPVVEGTKASGFLGAAVAGFLAGYLVFYLKKMKFPSVLDAIKATLVIPVVAGAVTYFVMAYPVAYTVGWLNNAIISNLILLSKMPQYAFLLGAILSAMCAFDMGGPLNKIAITFVFAVWNDPSGIGFVVNAALFPGIMVPALAVGISALIAKKKFIKMEKDMAISTILSGLVGITEATLPYAFRDPRVIPFNVIGSAVGGAIMMGAGVATAGVSGVFGLPMANNHMIFILAVLAGVGVSVALQVLFKKDVDENALAQGTDEEDIDIDIATW
ncbi:PTS fructose transporter subunit IIC [Clostridiaceae bacterium M8S5]|nr:PTS fructose transporter subunit IIC [Clostridiaceae bacterium M8S5]